jgi:hypothetical protein
MAASAAFELFVEAALAEEFVLAAGFVLAGGVAVAVVAEDGWEVVGFEVAAEVAGVEGGVAVDGEAAVEDAAFGVAAVLAVAEEALLEFPGAGFVVGVEVGFEVVAELPVGLVALTLSTGSA